MARPWEYPRWRRILMQVAMWVVFGAGLGLAQLVVHQRQHMPILLDPAIRLGPLWVRLPKDWTMTSGQDPYAGEAQVEEPEQGQELTVAVQKLANGDKGGQVADQPGAGTQPIYFNGLKCQGVMAALPQKIRTQEGAIVSRELLLAIADLPSGYELEIVLTQAGGKVGAGERRLVQAVANDITWAGPLPPGKRRSLLPQGPIQID